MIDVIDEVLSVIEPWTAAPTETDGSRSVVATSGTRVDLNAAEPFELNFAPNTLYGWLEGDRHEPAGSGNPIQDLERFGIVALYVADSGSEEPKQVRTRAVSIAIDTKVQAYLAALAANRSRTPAGVPHLWQHIEGTLDPDLIRDFSVRGAALRIAGYRHLPTNP